MAKIVNRELTGNYQLECVGLYLLHVGGGPAPKMEGFKDRWVQWETKGAGLLLIGK